MEAESQPSEKVSAEEPAEVVDSIKVESQKSSKLSGSKHSSQSIEQVLSGGSSTQNPPPSPPPPPPPPLPPQPVEKDSGEKSLSLGSMTRKLQAEVPNFESMSTENFEEIVSQFRKTFDEALAVSESKAKEYTDKAAAIEEALNALAEYNKKALEQLSRLTMDAISATDAPSNVTNAEKTRNALALVDKAKMLVETAEKQLEYSKQIAEVTKPLTLWRLDASKAVWEAQNALKLAEKKYQETANRTAVTFTSPPQAPSTRVTSDLSETQSSPGSEPAKVKPPMKVSIVSHSRSSRSSTKSSRTGSRASSPSVVSEGSSEPSWSFKLVSDEPRQPYKFWPKHVYTSPDGQVICYIKAPADCLRKKKSVVCTVSDPFAPWPVIAGHSEVIGRFVSIQPKKRQCHILPTEPWIIGIPHNYNKTASRETVLFMIEAGPQGVTALANDPGKVHQPELVSWRDVHTTDVVSGDKHYLETRLTRLTPVTFAPCARLKRDCAVIGPAGGRLVCMLDPRVSLTVQQGAVKVDLPFAIQLQQLDPFRLRALKEHNKSVMNDFIACSPLVYMTCAKKTLFSAIVLTIPIPDPAAAQDSSLSPAVLDRISVEKHERGVSGEDVMSSGTPKMSAFGGYDNFQKSLLLPRMLSGQKNDQSEITLMIKSDGRGNTWKVWPEADEIERTQDVVTFSLRRIQSCRLMALKMRTVNDNELLSRCAVILEQSLSQYLVYFALRQHEKEPSKLCLVLALNDQLDETLENLRTEGYTVGDKPEGPSFLCERQHLDVVFRSNIKVLEADPALSGKSDSTLKLTYTSAIANCHKLTVGEVDSHIQIGLDHYRGFLDIYCMREILVPKARTQASSSIIRPMNMSYRLSMMPANSKKYLYQVGSEKTHLARIVVTLPKQPVEFTPQTVRRQYEFRANDVVTPKYLRELSRALTGDAWRRLGGALELSRSRLQAIGGRAAWADEDRGYEMLLTWIKNLPVSANRFALLHQALITIGRTDLAQELWDANVEYDEESENANGKKK
ncbi:unnamed protein product [Calicophoron daubneyi]|uniref:Death domain-containing protein n=1 Tax=Calicophoron daubneyi TaxID=300641 RepID=A0AAV2TWL1_CALDB